MDQNEHIQYLLQQLEKMAEYIQSMTETIVFCGFLKDKALKKHVGQLGCIYAVIGQSIQSGNIRRAYLYSMMFWKTAKKIEKNSCSIKEEINRRLSLDERI